MNFFSSSQITVDMKYYSIFLSQERSFILREGFKKTISTFQSSVRIYCAVTYLNSSAFESPPARLKFSMRPRCNNLFLGESHLVHHYEMQRHLWDFEAMSKLQSRNVWDCYWAIGVSEPLTQGYCAHAACVERPQSVLTLQLYVGVACERNSCCREKLCWDSATV